MLSSSVLRSQLTKFSTLVYLLLCLSVYGACLKFSCSLFGVCDYAVYNILLLSLLFVRLLDLANSKKLTECMFRSTSVVLTYVCVC